MPINLTGNTIASTYDQLLHVDDGPTATAKIVYSGTGVATALKIATTHIEVDNVRIDGNIISTLDTNGNLILAPNGTGSVAMVKVAVTGGTISGITDLALADGGTGASTASDARTNLGLGTMATQNSGAVAITGGTLSGVTITGSFSGLTLVESVTLATSAAAAGVNLNGNTLAADGTDTNIDINITPKGTGQTLSSGKMGYPAGTGGTVTQGTSRTTGVTLNKITGEIVLFAVGIAGHEADEFVLTNSTIAVNDVIMLCIKNGGSLTAGTRKYYVTQVHTVAAGSCTISVGNLDNGAITSESPTLQFVVLKGAVA